MLTLGIPTYNRKDVIVERVKELINSSAYDLVEILIIDNDSPDGTFEHLKEICDGTPIRVLKNSKNIGFRGSFIRLFEECQTEYLIISSDEDLLILNSVNSLIKFLKKYKPLFVSTQYYLSNEFIKENFGIVTKTNLNTTKTYKSEEITKCTSKHLEKTLIRGQKGQKNNSRIFIDEIFGASAHMPGLIYKVEESKQSIDDIKFHIMQPELPYPHSLLAAELIMKGICFWWNEPILEEKCRISYNINPHWGVEYYHLPARWNQHKLFVDYFEDRIKNINDPEMKKRAIQMLNLKQRELFHNLWHAIKIERPEMIHSLNMSVIEFYFKIPLMREFIRRPMPSSKKLIKKILNLIHKSKKK